VRFAEFLKKEKIYEVCGELYASRKGNCYDAIAIETIKRLRFDKCFLTSACISASFCQHKTSEKSYTP